MTEVRISSKSPQTAVWQRVVVIVVIGLVLVGVIYAIYSFLANPDDHLPAKTSHDQTLAPGAFRPTKSQWTSFKIAQVQSIAFSTQVVTDGNIAIDDNATTSVFSPYSGRVTRLIAKPGDNVVKGAPLMAVESSEVAQGQNDLATAAAAVDTARSQLKLAQAAEDRQHQAYLADAGALKDWLQSQTDLVTAQNNLKSAAATLYAAHNRLRILGLSEAEMDAFARAPGARKAEPGAQILSPITGTVIQRQVGIGQYIDSITAGATNPVYVIADLSTVWLVANVRESDAPRIRIGQSVEVRVLAYPGRVFSATIDWIAAAVDPNTHRLPVRAEVRNPNDALKPNMFATFTIVTDKGAPVPAVPESAIVYEGDQAHVWVAHPDHTLSARQIRTGRIQDGVVEVSTGLATGEMIVTRGTVFLDRAADSNAQ